MAHLSHQYPSRKRSRSPSEEETSSEFTPLSKRINNLHINNAVWKHIKQEQIGPVLDQIAAQAQHSYSPDLGPADNPFYYESNRLLYNLYIERVQRTGMAPY